MTTANLTPPLVIAYTGQGSTTTCLSATQNAGAGAVITLQQIQWNPAVQNLQLWQFGSDGRIYLYAPELTAKLCVDFPNPPKNGQQLQLNLVAQSNQEQMWNWDTKPGFILNVGAQGYAIDNNDGHTNPGNQIQIWQQGNTPHQIWMPVMMPTYYLNSLASQAATTAG